MTTTRKILVWWMIAIFLPMIVQTAAAAQSEQQAAATSTGLYCIQVSAFGQLSSAETAVSRLREKGCDPFYLYEDVGSKGMWYRVYVGRHTTREAAREAAGLLVEKGIVKDYILRKMDIPKEALYALNLQQMDVSTADFVSPDKSPSGPRHEAYQAPSADGEIKPVMAAAAVAEPLKAVSESDPEAAVDDAAESTIVRLSMLDAIRHSLEGNREISVVAYEPKQAQAQIENTESVYDPLLFADSTWRRDPNLDSSVIDIVTEDDGRTRAGIRKPLKTGGSISTYLESRYADLNNAAFPRTYKNIVAPTVELQQPLLNNIGSKQEQTAIKIANFQANISDAEFRLKVIDVANRVARVYWKLHLSSELIAINRANLDMAEEVYRREAERHAGGISQLLDVERARSNAQVRRSTWLRSKEEYQLAMDRLKLLLNWEEVTIDSDSLVIPVELPRTTFVEVDETSAIETALANRPEIMKARQELMIREVDTQLAAHQRLPKLDAFGRYSLSGYGDTSSDAWSDVSLNDDDAWEVGIQFEWAIGNRGADARYRKKSLGRSQAKAQLRRVQDEIKIDVKQVLHRLETISREIESNRLAKQAAEKVVEGEFTRFDIGQTSNEELLRAQDLLAATSRSLARATSEYNTASHELTRVQGLLPEGISIEQANR